MLFIIMGVSGCGKSTVGEALASKLGWVFDEADDHHPMTNKEKMSRGVPLTDQDRLPWLLKLHECLESWYSNGVDGVMTCSALKKAYRRLLLHGKKEINLCDCIVPHTPRTDVDENTCSAEFSADATKKGTGKEEGDVLASVECPSKCSLEMNAYQSSADVSFSGECAKPDIRHPNSVAATQLQGNDQFSSQENVLESVPSFHQHHINAINCSTVCDPESSTIPSAAVYFIHLKGSFESIMSRLASRRDHFMPAGLLQSQLDILEEPTEGENHIVISLNNNVDDIVDEILAKSKLTDRAL